MLKIILKLSIFITGLLIITGCGGKTAAISKPAANTKNVSQLATKASIQDAISVTINGRKVRGQLNSTPEAKAFQTMLPLKIKMTGFGGREYYGPIEKKLEVVSAGRLNFVNGDITYCPTNNTVAIFYAQTDRPDLTMKVYTIGKITDDLSLFHDLNAEETMVFKME